MGGRIKNLLYQNNCKQAMNTGGGQIKGAILDFFVVKKRPFLYLLGLSPVS